MTKYPHQKLAKLADLQVPTLETDIISSASSPTLISDEPQETPYDPIPATFTDGFHQDQDNYRHTQYFDVRTPTANFSTTQLHPIVCRNR